MKGEDARAIAGLIFKMVGLKSISVQNEVKTKQTKIHSVFLRPNHQSETTQVPVFMDLYLFQLFIKILS